MNITEAKIASDLIVKEVKANQEIKKFLFSLGCYEGEVIKILNKNRGRYIIIVKNSRYGINEKLAKAIQIEENYYRNKI